ncbi:MAG TPA: hypothetical protein VG454_11295 [Gemmatimonadales bacterium]|nr:hypothetical protein [Gemmatimonadales bacterium]
MRPSLAVIGAIVVLLPYYRALPAQHQSSPLFQDHTPLTLRLEGDLKALFHDRGEKRTEHPARLRFASATDSGKVDVKLRTRGIFRLKLCAFPPIRIDLPAHKTADTPFAGQDKLKLVTHCLSGKAYERNLLKEYAVYRVFNALTDTSFRVRLAHITYIDSAHTDTVARYGFLIESDVELARREGATVLEGSKIHDLLTDPTYMTLVAMFQYLIGNTDWSVWGRHNITILQRSQPSILFAVPYDFDFSGAVDAPYASPPPQLPIHSVRERYYRGFCQPDSVLNTVLARFRAAKDSIYAAVSSVSQLPEGDIKGLLNYFDDFFKAIENRGFVQREFVHGCRSVPQ